MIFLYPTAAEKRMRMTKLAIGPTVKNVKVPTGDMPSSENALATG